MISNNEETKSTEESVIAPANQPGAVTPITEAVTHAEKPHEVGSHPPIKNAVSHILDLLGPEAVLIPIPTKQKHPNDKGYNTVNLDVMADDEYRRRLNVAGNLGVLLGEPSSGICSIDIDNDDMVEPFLKLNPTLRGSLRSKGESGEQIWVQMRSDYPSLKAIKTEDDVDWGEWRSTGGHSVIHGTHPCGLPYHFVSEAKPVHIDFDAIQWPEELILPWANDGFDDLVASDGQPLIVGPNESITVNTMFFAKKYMLERRIKFESALGEFFEYDKVSGIWKVTTDETIKRRILRELGEVATQPGLDKLFFKRTDSTANSIVSLLRNMAEDKDMFARRPPAVHVNNGMICFEADEVVLKTFHPDFLSRNSCPFDYDDAAVCPRFTTELLGSALDKDDIALIQKWAGGVLMGENKSHKVLLITGTAGGGKSTLMTVLEGVIGLKNVAQLRTEHLGGKFELDRFVGKTLLTGKDVSADFLQHKSTHHIKSLVGGDLLEAEKKNYPAGIQIRGAFNIGITCNSNLNIKLEGDAAAWRRRMAIVRYNMPPTQKVDSDLTEYLLTQEGPGILKWMVEGAVALINDLRQSGGIQLTPGQKERVESLLRQSDSIRLFVRTKVKSHLGSDITVKELQGAYYAFCEENGWDPLPISEVSRSLSDSMLQVHKVNPHHDIRREANKSHRGYRNFNLVNSVTV